MNIYSDVTEKCYSNIYDSQNELLEKFKSGNAVDFFAIWEKYLPAKIRNDDAVAQKLEFYLNIYFAIYPLKNNQQVLE